MKYTILIVLVPAFDPNAGGVQRSTYKMSSYYKSKGHDVHVFSYFNNGHAEQDVAHLHHAQEAGQTNNEENNAQLAKLVSTLGPDIVINQMPYEHNIGHTLRLGLKDHKYLLLGCLRNTLFSVKLNLEDYLKLLIPSGLLPLFNNPLGRRLALEIHRKKHAKDLKKILDTYDYFVMFGPPNIDELRYFVGDYKLDKTYLIPNSILSVLPSVPKKQPWYSKHATYEV